MKAFTPLIVAGLLTAPQTHTSIAQRARTTFVAADARGIVFERANESHTYAITAIGKEELVGSKSNSIAFPEMDPGHDWDQAVLSWNIPANPHIRAEIYGVIWRGDDAEHMQRFDLATWGALGFAQERTSHSIKHEQWQIDTDTIKLVTPARKIIIGLRLYGSSLSSVKVIKEAISFVGATLTDTRQPLPPYTSIPPPPIKPLDVPERCQMDYKDGNQHCSPTALAMDLAYWAYQLHRPELTKDVNEIIQDVYDKEYKGSGNWSFNVAYAGQFPGIRAYVARLEQIEELHAWVEKGVPVICSGSIFLLEGRERPAHDPGHLFVLVGFDQNGDPIFNDPGRFQVRQTYKLADFERAWDTSGRTVYLIYPEKLKVPVDVLHHWYTG